jgi:hypothetical protein
VVGTVAAGEVLSAIERARRSDPAAAAAGLTLDKQPAIR